MGTRLALDGQDQLRHHLNMVHTTELALKGYLVSNILATEAALKCSVLVELKLEREQISFLTLIGCLATKMQ